MPESSRRKKKAYTPPPAKSGAEEAPSRIPVKISGARWVAPVMVAFFLIGLLWIVVWYIAPDNPLMASLGSLNVAVGFVFIAAGFYLATKWQ